METRLCIPFFGSLYSEIPFPKDSLFFLGVPFLLFGESCSRFLV